MPNNEEQMKIIPEILSKYKKSFKKKIQAPFAEYKDISLKKLLDKDEDEIINVFAAAVAQGYDDAKRTFTGISKIWKSDEIKKEFFKKIARKIYEVFENPSIEFENWHKEACVFFQDTLNQMTDSNGDPYNKSTYGQAQKVINMAFKYLYCMDDADHKYYRDIFDQCHMPLDSFTLEWYRRYICKDHVFEKNSKAQLKSDTVWSQLDQEEYTAITALMNDKLSNKDHPISFKIGHTDIFLPAQPLYTEFIIWPEIQMHIAAEEFLFTFGNYPTSDKKKIKDSPDLLEKLDEIASKIKEYQKN